MMKTGKTKRKISKLYAGERKKYMYKHIRLKTLAMLALYDNTYPRTSLATKKPAKFVRKPDTKVERPHTSIVKESHLAAFVFFRIIFEGTSNTTYIILHFNDYFA